MRFQCDTCGTFYQLDPGKIKSSGTKVRCFKCGHVFLVLPWNDNTGSRVSFSSEGDIPHDAYPADKPPVHDISENPPHPDTQNDHFTEQFHSLIRSSTLSVRAINVICSNIYSLDVFMALDEKILLNYQSCGRKTVDEIIEFIDRLKMEIGMLGQPFENERETTPIRNPLPDPNELFKRLFTETPTEEAVSMLPLFSSNPLDCMSREEFHPRFMIRLDISDIGFSVRARNIFQEMNLTSLGDIMMTPSHVFLEQRNFGRTTLNEIKRRIQNLILYPHEAIAVQDIDYASYESMVQSFIASALKRKRAVRIVTMRILPKHDKPATYEEIGVIFNISRERVRQILKKETDLLKTQLNRIKLKRLWKTMEHILENGGGIIDLTVLCEKLQTEFNWNSPPNPASLPFLLELNSKFLYDSDNGTVRVLHSTT